MPEAAKLRNIRSGTVLAFDFGERRIGVAVGELQVGVAHAMDTIDAPANDVRFARIEALIREWQPVLLLVGLPLALDGSEHALTALARRFALRLQGRYGIETRLVDERFTSVEAEQQARELGLDVRKARGRIDQLAAKIILEDYFVQ
ncbi:MAG: Holliday junction resolvase RuvX [Betaproteobacteria bacterium]